MYNNLVSLFDDLKTVEDIQQQIDSSTNDGENSSFELKGMTGRVKAKSEDKTRFAKELCAFANTYGGVLCIHKGGDTDVQSFTSLNEATNLLKTLETWSRDSLEPRCPMRLKIVGNYLLIGVNESVTKPHRSANDKLYYYRHETQSEKMPEIMIASLYRGQAMLAVKSAISTTIQDSSLDIKVRVKNESRISGTCPRIDVLVYSKYKGLVEYFGEMVEKPNSGTGIFHVPLVETDWITWNDGFRTNSEFQKEILYPEDWMGFKANAFFDFSNAPQYFIFRIDAMFTESKRQTSYILYDAEHGKELSNCLNEITDEMKARYI